MNQLAPTPQELRELLSYDPETGVLTWKPRVETAFATKRAASTWNARYAGKDALTSHNGWGYRRGSVRGALYCTHRVAWALSYNEWPNGQIDHINGDRSDNRLANLRLVSHAENGRNQQMPSTSTSGVVGVHWYKKFQKWQAHITVSRRTKFLGYFDDLTEAVAARKAAELQHNFHANHGRAAQ